MSYSDFLNSLSSGINLFINSLTSFVSVLINNYIIVTLLGLSLFCSLFYLVIDLVLDIRKKRVKDYDHVTRE